MSDRKLTAARFDTDRGCIPPGSEVHYAQAFGLTTARDYAGQWDAYDQLGNRGSGATCGKAIAELVRARVAEHRRKEERAYQRRAEAVARGLILAALIGTALALAGVAWAALWIVAQMRTP